MEQEETYELLVSGGSTPAPMTGMPEEDEEEEEFKLLINEDVEVTRPPSTPPEQTILKGNPKDPQENTITVEEDIYNGREEEVNTYKDQVWKQYLKDNPDANSQKAWEVANNLIDNQIKEQGVGAVIGYRFRDRPQE